jgi:hypothetical protein
LKSNFERIAASGGTSKNTKTISSNGSQTTTLDDRTVGVLVSLLAAPEFVKRCVDQNELHYGTNSDNGDEVQGYNYITSNGDPTGYIYYQRNGNTITYKMWVPDANGYVATGHFVTKTATISRLINDYYSNQAQKSEVDGYVSKLQSE